MEQEEKVQADVSKDRKEEKEVSKKEKKSRDREREEKKSKKHRKHSSSRSSSDSSRSKSKSRSRSRKRSKKHKSHKSRRSRDRSRDRRSHSRSRKHRSRRSRSRSKDRDRERSRRDRDRERDSYRDRDDKKKSDKPKESKNDRKGFQFDSPPKDMQVAEDSINFAALGIPNLDVLKERYPALRDMDHSELINKLRLMEDMKAIQASKVDRKLYIGNIPSGVTAQMLMDLLNSALLKMGVNSDPPGNSIIGAWISPDNHYAFVDFRTPQEATNGFALNSVAIHGQTLKVGRPRSYQQTQQTENPLQILLGPAALQMDPLAMIGQGEGTMNVVETTKIQPPSRILILKNMVKVADLEIDEEYQDIIEDVKEECAKFGKVLSIKIPRPQGGNNVPGLGMIFVEFGSIDEAKGARKELQGRIFDENTVEVAYYDEEKYASSDFTDAQ